jgi:hypothetical protein
MTGASACGRAATVREAGETLWRRWYRRYPKDRDAVIQG